MHLYAPYNKRKDVIICLFDSMHLYALCMFGGIVIFSCQKTDRGDQHSTLSINFIILKNKI